MTYSPRRTYRGRVAHSLLWGLLIVGGRCPHLPHLSYRAQSRHEIAAHPTIRVSVVARNDNNWICSLVVDSKVKKKNNDRFEFTIIAGDLKGRRIHAPNLGHTRPPLSRLRKSIFDFLKPHLPGANYLDLFSGTGSYLFEAVSRGVASALGVESEPELVASIMRNAEKYKVTDRLQCREEDVFEAIPKLKSFGRLFDIVMIAPPQYLGMTDRTLQCLKTHPVIAPSGLLICQHDTNETRKIDFMDFSIEQQRKYGNTTFTVLRPSS